MNKRCTIHELKLRKDYFRNLLCIIGHWFLELHARRRNIKMVFAKNCLALMNFKETLIVERLLETKDFLQYFL